MKLLFPFNPPSPAPDKTPVQIPGASGDWVPNTNTFRAVETQVNAVIRIPHRYRDWAELKSDIIKWLYGQEDWLKFDREPEYVYRAQIITAPTFTPINKERINATLNFHFQPYKYRTNTIHWQELNPSMVKNKLDTNQTAEQAKESVVGIYINDETENVYPDWHFNGTGNFMLLVNDMPFEFDDIDGDVYLLGNRGNAYSADPRDNPSQIELLNDHIRLTNNWSPELLCSNKGKNKISLTPMDSSSVINKAEFIPRLRRLV